MTLVHNTGSAELDRILTERARIRAAWTARRLQISPPRPTQLPLVAAGPEKPLSERVAEAMALRGQISEANLHSILNAIHGSARDRGERASISFDEGPPEIAPSGALTIAKIQTVVAEHFGLTRAELLSRERLQRIALPRQIAMYMSKIIIQHSLGYIGRRFGPRDHTVVLASVKKIEKMIAADAAFAKEIEGLRGILGS